ncbi:ribonuclease H-like domain-containing protein [Tanacetum coccineum]
MGLLRTELEKVKEEKEGFEFKIAKFEKSSKDLDQLLASQITDKSKKGFGYNAVPSPHPLILNRPTSLDLSYSGLEEFKQPEVNEYGPRDSSVKPTTGCDKESDNSKENTDDYLKQQQKTDSKTSSLKVDKDWKEKFFCPANQVREEAPKKARENNDAPIIEDWVSDDEDDVESIPKVEKKTVIPTATKKEFVKPETPVRRSVSSLNEDWPKTVNNARPVTTVRHMSGNIAHLLNFKDFDGGYVTFGGGANGGRITGKCTIKTDKLDFDDVYFVKRSFKFNLLVSHEMFDKKNYDNMYSFDMKNIVPKDGLTCLVAKATSEESMLWHRRLGHVNFKNINKLVKENLDETSEILKNFIKEVENLVDKKVKIIRSDNGTEFKNKVMDEFCREKGIKREYSVARTPQQNGVAERKNRTLIEAARTMLADSKLPTTFWAEARYKAAIASMKPFGCHVTILNTLDKLGKFDGKSDEENKPMIEGNGPKWLIKELHSLHILLQQDQDWIAMPLEGCFPIFLAIFTKYMVDDAQIEDKDELHDEDDATEESHDEVSTALPEVNTDTPEDLVGPSSASEDSHMEDQEIELGNIPQSYEVPTTPHIRIFTKRRTKRISQALREPHGVEQIQEELLNSNCKRIEPIRIFLAYVSYMGFMVYQMDVEKCLPVCQIEEEDDIIFRSTKELCDEFEKLMKDKFQMSSMGELTFFLGLQVQQKHNGIFISQDKYVHKILKKFNYSHVKSASTPTDLEKPLVQDGDAADIDKHL